MFKMDYSMLVGKGVQVFVKFVGMEELDLMVLLIDWEFVYYYQIKEDFNFKLYYFFEFLFSDIVGVVVMDQYGYFVVVIFIGGMFRKMVG